MASSCCCVVCEHAAGVLEGESGYDLFLGAARVDSLGVVFIYRGVVEGFIDGYDLWEMGEGRCVRGVVFDVLEMATVVCG